MHHVVRMIVYAKTKEKALERAKEIFNERLTPTPFDYGAFFDDDGDLMSGSGRWGKMPPVELATSKEGKKLIDEGFKMVKKEHEENINNLRKLLKDFNNEELFEGKILDKNKEILKELEEEKDIWVNPYWFDHTCWKISKGDWLYDDDGEAIKNSEDLKRVLKKKYCEDKDAKVWVLPVDVHT